ncbi:arginine/serine-rich coiled-coil protein 2 isoform X2 [Achroia grisella]|nr:arginine/serine-rich coiled-coil protein 2 isoform X2 [Achroia grisella]
MDMSEDSQAESEPELPPAEAYNPPRHSSRDDRRESDESRDREYDSRDRRDRRRDASPRARPDRDRADRREPRRDDKYRSERGERARHDGNSRRGLLGDRPDDKPTDGKPPALMDLKPFGGEPPPGYDQRRSQDARDAVSPRFVDRDRREKGDRGERSGGERSDRADRIDRGDRAERTDRNDRPERSERDRDRHGRRSEERKSTSRRRERSRSRSRSRSRGAAFPPPTHTSTSGERRGSPSSGDYRPSSYKVNKKLEVMEKMGLQIKTPDGSMATAQQLRAAAGPTHPLAHHSHHSLPSYYNPSAVNTTKILDQVQKRKLLWSNKNKSEAEEAAKWSGTRFAGDDGKQVSKFMRLMGIKEPGAVKPENPEPSADPIKKQEELFQAMQAQYEVARATTHTMRGVGLGFQRGQY